MDRTVDRHRRVRAAEALDRRLELGPHVVLVIAVEQRADEAALQSAIGNVRFMLRLIMMP
jgi:hypothetical protein